MEMLYLKMKMKIYNMKMKIQMIELCKIVALMSQKFQKIIRKTKHKL